jgi:serine acetyltransferase
MNGTFHLIQSDLIQAKLMAKNNKLGYLDFALFFIRYRTCRIHTFIRLRRANKLLALIAKLYLDHFFIEIGKNTEIGKFFYMPHPRGIIIANNVVLGEHVHVGQYVTIGGSFKRKKNREDGFIQSLPIIGNKVVIAHGAVIGGPVNIGDNVIVGANAVVTKDVESNRIISGNNVISKRKIKLPNTCDEFEYLE